MRIMRLITVTVVTGMVLTACAQPNFIVPELRMHNQGIFIFGSGQSSATNQDCLTRLVESQLYTGYEAHNGGCLKRQVVDKAAAAHEFYDLVVNWTYKGEIVIGKSTIRVQLRYPEDDPFWDGFSKGLVGYGLDITTWVAASDDSGEVVYSSTVPRHNAQRIRQALAEAYIALGWNTLLNRPQPEAKEIEA